MGANRKHFLFCPCISYLHLPFWIKIWFFITGEGYWSPINTTFLSHLMGLDLIYRWFKVQWCFGVFLYRQVQRYICLFLPIHWFAKSKPAQSHILMVPCWSYWTHQRSISLLFSPQICITAPSSLADWSQIYCSKFIAHPVPCVCEQTLYISMLHSPVSLCYVAPCLSFPEGQSWHAGQPVFPVTNGSVTHWQTGSRVPELDIATEQNGEFVIVSEEYFFELAILSLPFLTSVNTLSKAWLSYATWKKILT